MGSIAVSSLHFRFSPLRLLIAAWALSLGWTGLWPSAAGWATSAKPIRILAFGDSLTAGYGLPEAESFTAQLEAALKTAGHNVTILNAGVSGDTTSGGLARVDWVLGDEPDLVLLALGANDGLRGIDPKVTEANLRAIIEKFQAAQIEIFLIGMLAPPNLGESYGLDFNEIYPQLAARYQLPFYPFFLDGAAANPSLNQPDGIHPNAKGVAAIVQNMSPALMKVLERLASEP